MKAQLILENGKRFSGTLFGAKKDVAGEVVFATGMTGYQEELTDPSLAGEILVMTFPLVGNYGINLEDMESSKAHLNALVVREKCDYPSNFRNEMNLDDFLKQQGVVGIEGIDTRALTRTLRDAGTMRGVIMTGEPTEEEVRKLFDSYDNRDAVMRTTTKEQYVLNPNGDKHVAFIDLGTKKAILRALQERNCKITVFPATVTADEIQNINPDMVFVSSGPGDPKDIPEVIETVRALVGKFPICGISLGHLVIGLALGCKTEQLKFGHHGGNQPVKDTKTGSVYITSQGHNFALVDLPEDVELSFVNVNDKTCEGIAHKTLPIQSVQFHPEACSGPKETTFVFDAFLKGVR